MKNETTTGPQPMHSPDDFRRVCLSVEQGARKSLRDQYARRLREQQRAGKIAKPLK